MQNSTVQDAIQLARSSFLAFVVLMDSSYILGDMHKLLIAKLQNIAETPGARLCVSVPPRHGKSRLISELFPAWCFGRNPYERQMAISYGASLAYQFGGKVRGLMNEPLYKAIFPWSQIAGDGHGGGFFAMQKEPINEHRKLKQLAKLQSNWLDFAGREPSYVGQYLATGVGGSLTGKPCDLGLLDDCLKSRAQADSRTYINNLHKFFGADFYSRLEPGARVVVVNTRWNNNDLIGYILNNFEGWEYLCLPAICEQEGDPIGRQIGEALFPEKYDAKALAKIRATVGELEWQSLYQQNPVAGGGVSWKPEYARFVTEPTQLDAIFCSWDCASELHNNADFSVRTTFGIANGRLIVLAIEQRRADFPMLANWLDADDKAIRPAVHIVEKASNGIALMQWANMHLPGIPIEPVSAHTNKRKEYAIAMEAFADGKVLFSDSLLATTIGNEAIAQLADFTSADHDDIAISIIQGIRYWQQRPNIAMINKPTMMLGNNAMLTLPRQNQLIGLAKHSIKWH